MLENRDYTVYASCAANTPGAKKDITGCSFMLAPMSDRYEELIMGAVTKVDTSRIWSETSKMGTVYRGRRDDVLDAVKACFALSWREDIHMTLTMTLAKGCPGDCDTDYVISEEAGLANEAAVRGIRFPVDVKFALYPLGRDDYMPVISEIIAQADRAGVYKGMMHYATVLAGDVHDIFGYFRDAFRYCEEHLSHFVFEITMSVNSPSPE